MGGFVTAAQLDIRGASLYASSAHDGDIDYVSWNPTHPELFCTCSQTDRRVVFWDARREHGLFGLMMLPFTARTESRCVQTCTTKYPPVQTHYSPDGKSILYLANSQHILDLKLTREEGEAKDTWKVLPVDKACC
jgi:THO complex subunit 3